MFAGMLLLLQALQAAPAVSVTASDTNSWQVGVRDTAAIVPLLTSLAPSDTNKRRVAIEYSDAYYGRLQLHRRLSYAELPLFGAEYYLGERLLSQSIPPGWIKPAHTAVALALGGLFVANTVTGLWNLWDSRHDPDQRGLIIAHSLLMLSADAGFMVTGGTATTADKSFTQAHIHRKWAVASMGVATVSTVMMWVFRR